MTPIPSLNTRVLPIAAAALTAGATVAFGSILTLIPIDASWQQDAWGVADHLNEARALAPDGRYVVGLSSPSGKGFLYDAAHGAVIQPNSSGTVPSILTGIGYRTANGVRELVVRGSAAGYVAEWIAPEGTTDWVNRCDVDFAYNVLPGYNSLGAQPGSDVYYVTSSKDQLGYPVHLDRLSGTGTPRIQYSNKGIPESAKANMNGVCASGRAVGHRVNAGVRNSYMLTWNVAGDGGASANYIYGLDGTTAGEAHTLSADGLHVFGRSPIAGDPNYYGYKAAFSSATPNPTQTATNALPRFGDEAGSTSLHVPYGCTADGDYAVGMAYRGQEKAVLWDTTESEPAEWTVTDLSDLASSEGILGGFVRLNRGYSVGRDATGHLVVAGVGVWSPDGGTTLHTRGFLMVVGAVTAPPLRITSVAGAATTSVTVTWTNTLAGSSYVLQYHTNLHTTNWTSLSPVTASGTTTSQTDHPPAGDPQRYYRVLAP
ncbi:MAG: hypothetical protein JXQ71_06820 [Verrucomicrobia bacterium]|nr:hypothetical protein [Verrucomicrobiota bacterium]